jgi:hypothetical protein
LALTSRNAHEKAFLTQRRKARKEREKKKDEDIEQERISRSAGQLRKPMNENVFSSVISVGSCLKSLFFVGGKQNKEPYFQRKKFSAISGVFFVQDDIFGISWAAVILN